MTPPSPTAESRQAILDAAEGRFASNGFTGTTIKEIAGDAGVNSALLYYYFADKEALYAAVVARLIERFAAMMVQSIGGIDDPATAIRVFAAAQGAGIAAQPHMRKLIGRELIDYDVRHAQAAIRHLAATTFDRLTAIIREGQRAGTFRADFDPRFAAISLVGQTAYFHFARPAVEILLAGGKPLPAGTTDAFAAHVAEFTLAALAPLPKEAPTSRRPAHRRTSTRKAR